MKNNTNQILVVDTYQAIDEIDNFGYEITYYNDTGDYDNVIVDLKYGFTSHDAAEKAGKNALKQLRQK